MRKILLGLVAVAFLVPASLRAADLDNRVQQLERQNAELLKRLETMESKQRAAALASTVDKAVATRAGGACLSAVLPDISGTGLFVNGEFLYMQPVVGGLQYAGIGSAGIDLSPLEDVLDDDDDDVLSLGLGLSADMRELEYDWAPGFRAGIGYRLPHDGWEILANFTYYETDAKDSVAVEPMESQLACLVNEAEEDGPFGTYGLTVVLPGPLWTDLPLNLGQLGAIGSITGDPVVPYERATGKAELDLYVLDLEVARRFKVSDTLNVRVAAGPRLLWLDQDVTATFYTDMQDQEGHWDLEDGDYHEDGHEYWDGSVTTLTSTMKSKADFFGAGVRVGMSGEMMLGQGFSLNGKFAGSMVAGEFDRTASETIVFTSQYTDPERVEERGAEAFVLTVTASGKAKYDRILPIVEAGMGIAWEKKLNDKLNLRIQAGYEFMQIFNMPTFSVMQKDDNMTLHGATLQLRFDF